MAIGAIIGLISTVFQAVRAFSPPEAAQPQQAADKLFSKLDELGQGAIGSAELQTAFDKIKTDATGRTDKLFSKLDADGDGKLTRNEFTSSINQLAEQLDGHFMRARMHGDGAPPPAAAEAGFSKEELTGLVSGITANFDKADANGDGRVSLKEARAIGQDVVGGALPNLQSAATENRNVELMLMVVRLMQAYGVVGGSSNTASNSDTAASKVSELA